MYSLVIKDKEYELPDTISISKWVALSNYDLDLQFTWNKVISIAMDIPQEDVELIPLKTKELIILFIRGLMNPLITRKKDELNGGKYKAPCANIKFDILKPTCYPETLGKSLSWQDS